MNTYKAGLFVGATLCVLSLLALGASDASDGVIVSNADDTWETSIGPEEDLQHSLALVDIRVIVQYANELRHVKLAGMSTSLQESLAGVGDRIVIKYGAANRQETLVYPVELFDDVTVPQISSVEVIPRAYDSVSIAWTTDEFATSLVHYGTQPGVYTKTVSSAFYAEQHEMTLTGLQAETRYYYLIESSDQSGNMATSSQRSFYTPCYVYVPLVIREY